MHSYPEEIIFSIVLGTALLLFFVAIFGFVILKFQKNQFRNRLEQSQMQKEYDQAILHVQIEVQNKTMQRIAEELHDNIGQLLSVARIHLNVVEEGGVEEGEEGSIGSIREANSLIEKSLSDLRLLTKSLDSDFLKDFGLVESIEQELGRIRNTKLFCTDFKVHGKPYSLGLKHDIVVFRVVQEILQNSIKHSKAKDISVTIIFGEDVFQLAAADNGCGFDLSKIGNSSFTHSGAGLRNIQRRIALLGGTCLFETRVGFGTSAAISLSRKMFVKDFTSIGLL
jgi:two-component system NarL family sensor kinase